MAMDDRTQPNGPDPFAALAKSAPTGAPGQPTGPDPFADMAPPKPKYSAGQFIRDSSLDLVQGGLDIGKQLYGLANVATGGKLDPASRRLGAIASEALTPAMNRITGQNVEATKEQDAPTVAQGFNDVSNNLSGLQSPYRQALEQERSQAVQNANGFLDETGAALKQTLSSPTLLTGDVLRSLPSMFMPAVVGNRIAGTVGKEVAEAAAQRALAAGATREAAQEAGAAAADKLAERAVIATTGVAQVGAGADIDTIGAHLNTPQAALDANPIYQQLLAQGMDSQQARDEMARSAGLTAAVVSAPISMAASKVTGAGAQLAKVATGRYAGKGIRDLGIAIGKEAAQEYPESFGEQYGQGLGLQKFGDTSTDPTKGAWAAAAEGALAGAFMGGGEHAVGHSTHGAHEQSGAHDAGAQPQAAPQERPAAAPAPAPATTDTAVTPPLPPDAGPLTRAASMAASARELFPFSDMATAQKQADAMSGESGIPYEATDHPSVLGRFAAQPVKLDGADQQFLKEAEQRGLDPVTAQLLASGDEAPKLFDDVRAYYHDLEPQQWRDPKARANLAAMFLMHERKGLEQTLGREPTPVESYIARQLGVLPAADLLGMSESEHLQPLSSVLPDAALEQRLGLTGMQVGQALQTLTSRAEAKLAALQGASEAKPGSEEVLAEDDPRRIAAALAKAGQQEQRAPGPANEDEQRVADEVDRLAHTAAASPQNDLNPPSTAQIAANNYKTGHIDPELLHGMRVDIENPAGTTRTSKDPNNPWQTTMQDHYGRFPGTVGGDGQAIDAFIGPNPASQKVFVVDQTTPKTGEFDEHKVMLGYNSLDEARQAYVRNYDKDWTGGKSVTETTVDGFKQWLKNGDTTKEFMPAAQQGASAPLSADQLSALFDESASEVAAEQAQASTPPAPNGRRAVGDMPPHTKYDDYKYGYYPEAQVGAQHLLAPTEESHQENEKNLALAKTWGYTDDTVPVDTYGRVDLVFHPDKQQTPVAYDNKKPGKQRVAFDVRVAQGPNGQWAYSTHYTNGDSGGGSYPNLHDKPYASRDAAVQAAIQELKAGVFKDNAKVHALIDKAAPAPAAATTPTGTTTPEQPGKVNYPNRQLGFQQAKTDPQDEYNDHAWANIAAANMRVGDTFELNRTQQTVESISGNTLKLKDANGKVRTYNPDGVAWGQFQRDLGGQLTMENLGAKSILHPPLPRPLLGILRRDPAVHVDDQGSVYLKDGGEVQAPGGHSAQYDSYRKAIEAGKYGKGMAEQIATDERLHDGESGALLDMIEAKAKAKPGAAVVSAGASGKPAQIDHARLTFVGAADGSGVSDSLKVQVQEALRTRPDSYTTGYYNKDDTRLKMPATSHTSNPHGGQFQVKDDGRVLLMGDDAYGWASTMSQKTVTRTLTDWLKNMGEAPAKETVPPSAYDQYRQLIDGGEGTPKLAERIRRDPALSEDQVQALLGTSQVDTQAETASLERTLAFAKRATALLPQVNAVQNKLQLAKVKAAMQQLADDMAAVNDRFTGVMQESVHDLSGIIALNTQGKQAPDKERQAGKRVVRVLQEISKFGEASSAPEHAGGQFQVYNPDEKFVPTATGSARGEAEIDESVIPLTMNSDDFKEVTDEWASLFEAPGDTLDLAKQVRQTGEVKELSAAEAQLAEWKAHVAKQGEEHRGDNFGRTVLSLFDLSGEWSKPWREAGYNVITFDIQTGQDINDFSVEYFNENYDISDVYAILAAVPCTDFTQSANRYWKIKDANGKTEASKQLVLQTLRTIEYFRPKIWSLENPRLGRIRDVTGLPAPRLIFQPHNFGDPHTKETALYGKFNPELPLNNVKPAGSKTNQTGGSSIDTKNDRSETPEGFAYAFFMANNYIDQTPEQRLAGDFPELSGAVKAALKAGMSEEQIRDVVTDTYEDYDPDGARDELVQAVADHAGAGKAEDDAPPALSIDSPGQWGDVNQPLKFYSGMSRPGDFTKLFGEHRNVGITIKELSIKSTPRIAAALAASNGQLFVDSGAFPVYKRNERAFTKALKNGLADFKGEEVLSFDQIMDRYDQLRDAILKADEGDAAIERAFFVMPDVIGRQAESLRLVGEYASRIKDYGDRAVVPLQVGELSLTRAYESMMLELGLDPDQDESPVIGIPSNAQAVSNEELAALLKKHGDTIRGVHILGAVADARLAPRLEAIRAAGYDGNVSADANRLRALMYGERPRAVAWEALLAESAPQNGPNGVAQTEAGKTEFGSNSEFGKEVYRFAGKYGKGMAEVNAQMHAANQAKAHPDITYTVEAAEQYGPAKYEVVGREKAQPAAAAALPTNAPQHLPLFGINTETEAQRYGLPADFYAEAKDGRKLFVPADQYRTEAYSQADKDQLRAMKMQDGDGAKQAQKVLDAEMVTMVATAQRKAAQAERDQARAEKDRADFAAQPRLWTDSPFAPRITAVLDKLVAAGQEGYAKAINGGFNVDAKNRQLDEAKTAFREENVRKFLLSKAKEGQPIEPVAVETMTADKLAELTNVAPTLPQAIVDAAVERWNALAPALGAQGFADFKEVHSNDKQAAQDAAQKLREILNALDGLAARRYQEAKEHKNLNPDAVARNEAHASEVLGIDTTQHPGIDTSKQITLGAGVKEPQSKAAITREGDEELLEQVKAWGYTDDNLPKGGAGGGIPLSMRSTVAYEFDNKRTGKEQASYTIQAAEGPNGQWGAVIKYALGGGTQDSAKGGSSLVGWDATPYPSRQAAVQAAFDRMLAKVDPDLYSVRLHNSFKPYLAQEAYQAKRATLADAQLRFAKGFATPEQEVQRIPLLYAVWQAQEGIGKDRDAAMRKAVAALAKLPQGRLTLAGAVKMMNQSPVPGKFTANDYRNSPFLAADYIAPYLDGKTAADIDAVYQEYVDYAHGVNGVGTPMLTKDYFLHALKEQDKANKPAKAVPAQQALDGTPPMDRKEFIETLTNQGAVRFGEASFAVKNVGGSRYQVNATYPHHNAVVGAGAENLSLQQAVARAAGAAFDWWNNDRVKDAAFATQRDKLIRSAQREVYGMLARLPGGMGGAAQLDEAAFTKAAQGIINDWLDGQYAQVGNDSERRLQLDNLRIGGQLTLPKEFYASLHKYAKRNARAAAQLAARDPAVYKQALLQATLAAQLPVDADQVALFMAGWDHALAGKTKSTLPAGELFAKGYEAAQAWAKTDTGRAWYEGKPGRKLENTGVTLRRWHEQASQTMAELSADNLQDAYEVIKAQTSRANAFADLAGEGATPGTVRYLTDLRNMLVPFQEWLLEDGSLYAMGGKYRSGAADSVNVAAFLAGDQYVSPNRAKSNGIANYPGEAATPQQRLDLLRHEAGRYLDKLRMLTEALQGATSVRQAAQRFDQLLLADRDKSTYDASRFTKDYQQLQELFRRHRNGRFEERAYQTEQAIKNEDQPDDPNQKKQPLVTPRLDRVVREDLADYRKGENVTPQQVKDTFGFADVGFGQWVGAKQDQDHLNYAYDAFMDLANFLGIPPTGIGLGGKLHFTIGALGHGKFAAHFQYAHPAPDGAKVEVINLTNTRGDGTVAHEWFHALDHALRTGYTTETKFGGRGSDPSTIQTWDQHPAIKRVLSVLTKTYDLGYAQSRVLAALTGDSQIIQRGRKGRSMDNASMKELVQNAEQVLDFYKDRSRPTAYKKAADALGADYWGNPRELIARAAEAYVHDRLEGMNNYLVNPEWVAEGKVTTPQYKGTPYPTGEERKLFGDALAALVKALRFDFAGATVDMAAFEAAVPSNGRVELNASLEAMRERLDVLVQGAVEKKRALQREAERRQRERAQAQLDKQAADKAAAEQQAAEQAAAQAAETARLAEEERVRAQLSDTPPSAPQGPLSTDELEALFDQASDELAEEAQETPNDAPAPGEPAAAVGERWTQDDYRFLLDMIEKEKYTLLLADASQGLPTIHDLPHTAHLGYSTLRSSTPDYEVVFEGGGAMRRTPSGQAYTPVHINRGKEEFHRAIGWDQAKATLRAKLIVKDGPKAAPTLTAAQQKTAGQLVADAAKLGVTGINEALEGLVQLFGGNKLKSFPAGMDKESYEKAKPHFIAALKAFQEAGQSLKELFKFLIQKFGPGIKPYVLHFAQEQALGMQLAAPLSATRQVADWVEQRLQAGQAFTSQMLFTVADQAHGGTQAEGKYSVKDAYDAMEAGVNRYIMDQRITPDGSATDAVHKIAALEQLLTRLPTQTRRTQEMDEFQQFSTPPQLAFTAAWVANIRDGEVMLEPSAGIGGLAVFGELAGAQLALNELSGRRAAVLHEVLPEALLFQENAEQLHNILPDEIKPSVIVMNPPFSATAGRVPGSRDTAVGAQHIEQALKRLQPGGRLVAIVGTGMADDKPAFKAWWSDIKKEYTVRANIGMDGANYAKYGTTFDNQLLVIDKTGKTTAKVLTGTVQDITSLPALLEGVRNDRQDTNEPGGLGQPVATQQGGNNVPAGRLGNQYGSGGADADALGAGQRPGAQPDGPGPGPAGGAHQPDGAVGTAPGDGVPDQPGKRGGRGNAERGQAAGGDNAGGSGGTAAGTPARRDGGDGTVGKAGVTVVAQETARNTAALTDAIFENYTPQRLNIPGAKAHPGLLVQSAAMAAIDPPIPTYTPNLPKAVISKGMLSLPQLEAVIYAGQAHQQIMPNGERRGFFIGDGTGVGKGREIAGIILDNQRQGRKKAVWISEKQGLIRDAKRDMLGVGANGESLFPLSKTKASASVANKEGVLFTTYDTLGHGGEKKQATDKQAKGKTRLEQMIEWFGKDYDGVIVFDEAHNMANVESKKGARGMTKPSAKALAGVALQQALPKARFVYVSATGATEVSNLAYATRLGLWGEGTAFAKPKDFIANIENGGVAAMELVSRDMKAMGAYIARSLSFEGVTYDRLEHELTSLQTDIYNELAKAWQVVLQNINTALEATLQGRDGKAKSAAMSRFWGSHQRFFNQIITSLQMPSIVADAKRQLAEGHAVVFQLVNTNEAEQERQAAKIANDKEASFEDLDFTPRQTLIDYVQNGFPVQQFEVKEDEDGKKSYVPVKDSEGKPVFNKDMIAMRDALVQTLTDIRVPDNPIDMLINAFGADKVAEVTGRSRRFVRERNDRGEFVTVEQKRAGSAAVADAQAFMDDKHQVLIFSDAGGTGYSFHADLSQTNQRQRVHYLVQPGWRANKAVQGFGRTHRTNEASQPTYVLATTNLKAQKRFISSIARRLDQLGALTKGQRQTGSQGMFSATDNLESQYASDALKGFFLDMYHDKSPLDFHQTAAEMGLNGMIDEDTGALNQDKLPPIPQFLNRLLSLTTDRQDAVFDEFFRHLEDVIAAAKANGTYDAGVETIRADVVNKLRDEVAHTDPRTGAQTRYVELGLMHPTLFTPFDKVRTSYGKNDGREFVGFYRAEKNGKVFALTKSGSGVDADGKEYIRGYRDEPSGHGKFVDNIATVVKAAKGDGTNIKRTMQDQVYKVPASGDLVEHFTLPAMSGLPARTAQINGTQLAEVIARDGYATTVARADAAAPGPRKEAGLRLLERMKAHLVLGDVERSVPAYTALTPAEAEAAWAAQQADTPATYPEPLHLITGVLLPVWDRIPGQPQVVRTQTTDGERLLGRVVRPWQLTQTLKNLGVDSKVSNMPPSQVLERLLAGDKALLGNGWEIKKVTVSNDTRLEIAGHDLAYSHGDQQLLKNMGAFIERIQWTERVFLPTGQAALPVLERVLKAKPLVDLLGKEGPQAANGNDELSVEQPKVPYGGEEGAGEPGYNDPYAHTETRPGTTAAQLAAGRSAVAALARRIGVARIAGWRDQTGGGGTVLGQSLLNGFVAGRPNQLTGHTVNSPADLAALAQVYRDPTFEIFRAVFVRGQDVVGESGYSARDAASVILPPSFAAKLASDMRAFGADGYYLLHNHPSGKATASQPDIKLTQLIAQQVPGMLSHVIIDHNEYGVITPDGTAQVVKDWTLNGVDYRGNPAVPHALLGTLITGDKDVANLARALQVPDAHATLIFTTASKVSLMVDVPMAGLMDMSPKGIMKGRAMMRALARAGGANGMRFIVLPDGADATVLSRWASQGVVTDVVTANGQALTRMGIGGTQDFNSNKPALRVYEPPTPYNHASPNDDAPKPFNGKPAQMARKAGQVIKASTVTSLQNKGVDYRGLGLQTLGRRQLTEIYGKLFPQEGGRPNVMQEYNALAMLMDAEKNEAGAKADGIAVRWGKLKDHAALAELMHDATLYQLDPRKPLTRGIMPSYYNWLRKRYEALSPEAQAIFGEAANAYDQHYQAVRKAVRNRIVRALPDHPRRAELLRKMDSEMFGELKGIYFPLARFGNYVVRVRGPEGTTEAVSFAETMAEAQATHASMVQEFAGKKGYDVLPVILRKEFNAARDGVGRGFLQQLYGVLEATGNESAELQDAISQLYLTSLPDLSWAKHGIHRKGTPGYSQDARRAFAHNMFHGARYLAKLHYVDRLTDRLDEMQDYVTAHNTDAQYDGVKAQQVVDEMVKRHELYLNPKNGRLSTALTSAGFVFYLGLSPASAMVNLSQTALVAYPILGARYGFGKSAAALLRASRDATVGHNDMDKVLQGDELAAYNYWVKIGLIDVSMAHDVAAIAAGQDDKLYGKMGTVMKAASFLFHHAERFNRQATALAAYRLAREQGKTHQQASDAAIEDTYAGHFDYAAGNRPRIMQGDVARVVLLFKQYGQNMVYTFARNAALSFKRDPKAMKTLGGLLVTHALAAGVLGLPAVTTLLWAASMIGGAAGDDDEPWDAQVALRNLLADTFGDQAGEVMAHGLSRLTPWDVSARVGLNSMLFPDLQEGLEGQRFAESLMAGLLGPMAGLGVNLAKGMNDIGKGDWQRGLEEMLPAVLRGPLRALRYDKEGVRDRTGIEVLPETTAAEEAGQVLGFSPSRAREAQEGKSAIYQLDKALQERRQSLLNEFAAQQMNGGDTSDALAAIAHFNALHPSRRIAALHLQQSIRARMRRIAQAQDGIYLPKARRDAREAGAFANETP